MEICLNHDESFDSVKVHFMDRYCKNFRAMSIISAWSQAGELVRPPEADKPQAD